MGARGSCRYNQLETMREIKVEKISNEYKFSIKLGAVLIKNYSSFEKYVKKVPRGFS